MNGLQPVPPTRATRRRRRIAAFVALVAVAGAVAVWWYRPGADVVESGETVELAAGVDEDDLAHETEVVTPAGVYDVRLGEPAESIAGDELAEDELVDPDERPATVNDVVYAPRGSSFWPVEWQPAGDAPPTDAEIFAPARSASDGAPPTLAVAVDGDVVAGPYPLDGSYPPEAEVPPAAALAVAASAGEVTVEVAFDGVTQVVDVATGELEAGVASAYYGPAGDESEVQDPSRCGWDGDLPRGVGFGQLACGVYGATISPWDPELGWVSEPGQSWATVELRAGAYSQVATGGGAVYLDTGGRLSGPTLADGTTPGQVRPTSEELLGSFGREVVATWLLDEPVDRIEVRLRGTLRLTPAFDSGPDEPATRTPLTAVLDVPLTGA